MARGVDHWSKFGHGQAVVLELAAKGVTIAASARRAEKLSELAAGLPNIHAFPLDITDPDATAEIAASIESQFGPIDLAIMNAGLGRLMSARKFDVGAIRNAFETNYMGAVHGLGAALLQMIETLAMPLCRSVTHYILHPEENTMRKHINIT